MRSIQSPLVFVMAMLIAMASEHVQAAETGRQEAATLEAGVQAVIYGLPLVMMDLTMKRATNVPRPIGAAAPVMSDCFPEGRREGRSRLLGSTREPGAPARMRPAID